MKSEKEIIKLDNESDEFVIERNKCCDPDPYLQQREIAQRMHMRNALLWVLEKNE